MVDFLAKMSVDMNDLVELGELHDWDAIQTPNTRITTKITATLKSDSDIKYKFIGKNLIIAGEVPIGGKIEKIVVLNKNEKHYQIEDLSITFTKGKIESTFASGFESSLFNGNDSIVGSGEADILVGYQGADKIKAKGGADNVAGKKGGDKLKGNGGDDEITGNKGKDLLDGGKGNDSLTGGPGKDKFVFDSALNAATNIDSVTDFTVGKDMIKLDSAVFAGIGPDGTLSASKFVVSSTAQDGDDLIVYDQATGALYYDGDGSGGNAQIQFATLAPGLDLRAADFIVFS